MIQNKNRSWQVILGAILALMLLITLTACGNKNTGNKDKNDIKVITSVNFYGEVAKAVLGNAGTVTSIINKQDVDPHDYEPTTKVAAQVASADVLIANGLGYDSWMEKLAQNNNNVTSIKVGEDVLGKKDGANPHIWYQLNTMPKLANYLADKFSKINPKKASYFKANAQKYIKSMTPLNNLVTELKGNGDNKLVDVSEPVFDYALAELGYRVNNKAFAESVENSTDPAPKSVAAMQKDIETHKITFFVQNTQASNKTTTQMVSLAKKNHIPIVKVTETQPTNKNYQTWMIDQFKQVQMIQQKTGK